MEETNVNVEPQTSAFEPEQPQDVIVEKAEEVQKPYEIQQVCAKHLFKAVRILKCFDKKQLKEVMKSKGSDKESYGTEVIFYLIENVADAERPIYDFLASISNLSPEEIGNLQGK